MKRIILTGGGTAGHITPNIALLPKLKDEFEVFYVGSKTGMEKEMIEACGVPYYGISSGKLRRYLDMKNITDAFSVVKGIGDAVAVIKKLQPDAVFSKGGFVTVPVVIAAKLSGVPVVIHESDMTPGLANRISIPLSKYVCVSFPETLEKIAKKKGVLTGSPIREELFKGSKVKGLKLCGFDGRKPILFMTGGSQGSVKLNKCLRQSLPKLLNDYDIVHQCGKGNLEDISTVGYRQFEFINDGLADIFAAADVIVSRAGANSIFEFVSMKKPNLLIPLARNASRGDQIQNAESFKKQGFSAVLFEEDLTDESFVREINVLYKNRAQYIDCMSKAGNLNATEMIAELLKKIQ